ncbi:hypothetical protein GY45DRAFT_1301903 [Cubamyces sp. BRFM 1775]|nr:hypothetical protein GY45DRAFT_1301903 [Cubamyces sp. BRFM 1775]
MSSGKSVQVHSADGTASAWTKNKGPSPSLFLVTEKDHVHTSRKHRVFEHGTRALSATRLDIWLSGLLPPTSRPWLLGIPMLSTMICLYGLFCVLVLSCYVFSGVWRSYGVQSVSPDSSILEQLQLEHLLSKVSSLHSHPLKINPNILSTPTQYHVFSACLWTTDTEIEHIENWAAEWRGPFSLLVTTTAQPSSPQQDRLTAKLAALQRKHPPLQKNLFVHFLHIESGMEIHPNALLNLARLLAPSPRVVLFPGNLSVVPPRTLYRTLLHQQPSSSSAMTPGGHARKRKPAILTSRDRTSFPFAPLAPLVLARDDATWCTERFFADMPRSTDWEECLWQVWLGNFGDLEVRQVDGISGEVSSTAENAVTVCSQPSR